MADDVPDHLKCPTCGQQKDDPAKGLCLCCHLTDDIIPAHWGSLSAYNAMWALTGEKPRTGVQFYDNSRMPLDIRAVPKGTSFHRL